MTGWALGYCGGPPYRGPAGGGRRRMGRRGWGGRGGPDWIADDFTDAAHAELPADERRRALKADRNRLKALLREVEERLKSLGSEGEDAPTA